MKLKHISPFIVLMTAQAWVSSAGATPPHLPAQGPAPLLYVRLIGPTGARVTLYQGTPQGRSFETPVTVGLRPGYIYRVEFQALPEFPGITLAPTLEVRGTLQLPPQLRAADYPAPVVLTKDDVERVLSGALITKVIYLEHPEKAAPVATRPDQPLETEIRPDLDPVSEARILGRPLLIVRFGGRQVDREELACHSVAGTVLLPGDKSLPPPAVRPWVPWACMPVYDPYLGPQHPEEECLHDGGDGGVPAGFDNEGRLRGLDPADTVAEYKDSQGVRRLAISNRVCICVPRFAVLRIQTTPTGYDIAVALAGTQGVLGGSVLRARQPSLEVRENEQLRAMQGSQRPSGTESRYGTVDVTQFQGTGTVSGKMQEQSVTGTLVHKAAPPACPLVLCKSADKQAAQVGDVVTFYLRYTNPGGQAISDIVVSDSLIGRLEYVPGSAKTDREAVFTMRENGAGSLILRWEIGGQLLPGQSGVVSFQARIR
jgi:uncharacterized repeat protein (TIGR01451 family)